MWSSAGMASYQAAIAAWEVWRRRRVSNPAALRATPGMRGLGLFLLLLVVAYIGDAENPRGLAAGRVMLAVNVAVAAFGALSALGLIWVYRETRGLRAYLATKKAKEGVGGQTHADHR
jgi:hypothetical protein